MTTGTKVLILALVGKLILTLSGNAFAEEPQMRTTLPEDNQTISQWIMTQNPPCNEYDKVYQDQYAKVLTDVSRECKRYRPWVCLTSGLEGVDIEDLPRYFCQQY